MAVMQGLANYEIYKTGFGLFLIICFLICAIGCLIYSLHKNYQKTTGNIVTYINSQTLTYTVDKLYVQNIPFITTTTNNITSTHPAHESGSCVVYYAKNNPQDYAVNSNPVFASEILTCFFCILSILVCMWFVFLRSHKDVAGVVGGLDAVSSIASIFGPRRGY